MVRVDRISSLPHELLHDILSHLNVIQVFKSSLLSKRWKNLWPYVRKVIIEDNMFASSGYDFEDRCYLKNFVDNFIMKRHPQTDSFRISCQGFFYNPTEFDMPCEVNSDQDYLFCLISEIMRIEKPPEVVIDNMPKLIHSDRGKCHPIFTTIDDTQTLVLSSLVLRPDYYEDQLELSYKNSLENLTVRDCVHAGLRQFRIRSPCLKKLILENNDIGGSDVESCVFELRKASSLKTIELKGYMYQNYIFEEGLPSLLTAHLDIKVTNERGRGKFLWNALRGISNSQSLTISTYGFHVGGQLEWEEITFPMLKYVKLQNVQGEANELKFLQLLVEHAMSLEKINVTLEAYDASKETKMVDFKRKVRDFVCSRAHPKLEFVMKQLSREYNVS